MEIKILEQDKKRLVFEMKGEGHTLSNLLEKELWNDEDVTAAGYHVAHPLVGVPVIVLETNGKKSPVEALHDAIKRLRKQTKEFSQDFAKILK